LPAALLLSIRTEMQRHAQVLSVSAQSVTVRLQDGPCTGCATGCGGRCDLFRSNHQKQLTLATGVAVVPGQQVVLIVSDEQLRRAALKGYGHALLGMLSGAAVGAMLARCLGFASDPMVLIGLVLGVAASLWFTRLLAVNPVLTPLAADYADS
jgi:positive regulator of sigma E activity